MFIVYLLLKNKLKIQTSLRLQKGKQSLLFVIYLLPTSQQHLMPTGKKTGSLVNRGPQDPVSSEHCLTSFSFETFLFLCACRRLSVGVMVMIVPFQLIYMMEISKSHVNLWLASKILELKKKPKAQKTTFSINHR